MKRLISILISIAMVLSSIFIVFADNNTSDDCGIFIDADAAATMSLLFVNAKINEKTSSESEPVYWNESTTINKILYLKEVDEDPLGYVFGLNTNGQESGYIVCSAWSGLPLFWEYSDTYSVLFERYENESIIYPTSFFSYTDSFEDACESCFRPIFNPKVNELGYISTILKGEKIKVLDLISYANGNTASSYIDNPSTYLANVYGPDIYTQIESASINSYLLYDYTVYDNDCSVCAISDVVYLSRYSALGYNYSYNTIYTKCREIGLATEYFDPVDGVYYMFIDDLANDLLDYYNSSWSATNFYSNFYSRIKAEVGNGRASVLSIALGYYYNHSLTAYGYESYSNSTDATVYQFAKVKDGWASSSTRYVCINSSIACLTLIKP